MDTIRPLGQRAYRSNAGPSLPYYEDYHGSPPSAELDEGIPDECESESDSDQDIFPKRIPKSKQQTVPTERTATKALARPMRRGMTLSPLFVPQNQDGTSIANDWTVGEQIAISSQTEERGPSAESDTFYDAPTMPASMMPATAMPATAAQPTPVLHQTTVQPVKTIYEFSPFCTTISEAAPAKDQNTLVRRDSGKRAVKEAQTLCKGRLFFDKVMIPSVEFDQSDYPPIPWVTDMKATKGAKKTTRRRRRRREGVPSKRQASPRAKKASSKQKPAVRRGDGDGGGSNKKHSPPVSIKFRNIKVPKTYNDAITSRRSFVHDHNEEHMTEKATPTPAKRGPPKKDNSDEESASEVDIPIERGPGRPKKAKFGAQTPGPSRMGSAPFTRKVAGCIQRSVQSVNKRGLRNRVRVPERFGMFAR